MKSWASSLALHALALGCVAALWQESPDSAAPSVARWRVGFVTPPAEPAAEPKSRREPPRVRPSPAIPPISPIPPSPAIPASPPMTRPVLPASPPEPPPAAPVVAQPRLPEPALESLPAPTTPPGTRPVPAAAVASASLTVPVAKLAEALPVRVPAPATPAAQPAENDTAWRARLLARLRALHRYPPQARRLGQAGEVLLEARFGADGGLEAVAVKRTSGYPMLDGDALALLRAAARDLDGEAPPERPRRLEIPVGYELAD